MSDDLDGGKGSVTVREDGTRVEILPRPYGASITTTKPDGSSETIKLGVIPPNDKFIRSPIATPSVAPLPRKEPKSLNTQTAIEVTHVMSAGRMKVIGAGVLLICVISMIQAKGERETPSLGWMVALSATWALTVWLQADVYTRRLLRGVAVIKWESVWDVFKTFCLYVMTIFGGVLILFVVLGQFNIGPASKEKLEREDAERKKAQESQLYKSLIQGLR